MRMYFKKIADLFHSQKKRKERGWNEGWNQILIRHLICVRHSAMPAMYISSNINFTLIIIIFLYFTDKKTKTKEILLLFTFLSLLIFFERVVYIHFLYSLLTQFLFAVWLLLSPRCKTSCLTFSGFVRVDPVLFLETPSSISGTWLSWFNFYCSSCSLYTLCSLNKDEILFHSKWTWWLPCSLMVKYLNLSNQDHRSYSWLKHISLIFALCILISFFPDWSKLRGTYLWFSYGRECLGWNLLLMTLLFPSCASAWWLLLETQWPASADSLLPQGGWHCDPFRLSHILLAFTAFAGHPAVSAKGSPGLILFFSNWSFWPIIFCGNPLQNTTSQLSAISNVSLDTENNFGSHISQGKNSRGLGGRWRKCEEAISTHSPPISALKICFLSSGYSVLAGDPRECYLFS